MSMQRHQIWSLVISTLTLFGFPVVSIADVIYVDDDASQGGDGLSWNTAFHFLQDAMAFASDPANGVTEIRVGQGQYLPDRNEQLPLGTVDRTSSFHLINGIKILGGFAGIGMDDPNARDMVVNETVLNGLMTNTTGSPSNCCQVHPEPGCSDSDCASLVCEMFPQCCASDSGWDDLCVAWAVTFDCIDTCQSVVDESAQALHVLIGTNLDESTILDGLVISSGLADDSTVIDGRRGGGLLLINASPTIRNCRFEGNGSFQTYDGGAIACIDSSPVIRDCIFKSNLAGHGGSVYNLNSSPLIDRCLFEGVESLYWQQVARGGGIYNHGGSPLIKDSVFFGLSARSRGGAIVNVFETVAMIHGCVFTNNRVIDQPDFNLLWLMGGAVWNAVDSSVVFENCIFNGNSAGLVGTNCGYDNSGHGGAVASSHSTVSFINCIFENNTAARSGGAIRNDKTHTTFTQCRFINNSVPSCTGGAMSEFNVFFTLVTDCLFEGNEAVFAGAYEGYESKTTFVNSTFRHNQATKFGGGCFGLFYPTDVNAINCVFNGNTAPGEPDDPDSGMGGAIFVSTDGHVTLRSCTLVNNSAGGLGDAIYIRGEPLPSPTPPCITIRNSILWNDVHEGMTGNNLIDAETQSCLVIQYSCLPSLPQAMLAEQIIIGNPIFANSLGQDNTPGTEDDDLRLNAFSPCIDAGDNTALLTDQTTDLLGLPRVVDDPEAPDVGNIGTLNAIVDIGAFERQPDCRGDLTGDGAVDVFDLLELIENWGITNPESGDLNDDGGVDNADLQLLLAMWGICPM